MILGAILAAACFLQSAVPALAIEADQNSAVIFVYQRIGDDSVPQSSLSVEQFREHLSELKAGGYNVLPLPRIVAAIKSGEPLPHKTVGISFEGAYLPTLNIATPLLDEAGFPFTIFFASDQADSASPNHMSWDQLKSMKKDKLATFGILPSAYAHMTDNTPDANAALINKALGRYRDVFKEEPVLFAWPYGEYSAALKKQIAGYNFAGVFGQHSGVLHKGSDFLALPRFSMTDEYGDLDHFLLTASALPLPVTDLMPEDTIITQDPPVIGFTVSPEIKDLSRLSCFISDVGKANLTRLGNNRVEIRLTEPLQDHKTRINCTLPSVPATIGDAAGWRWFGMLLLSPGHLETDETPATPVPDEDPDTE